MPLALTLMGSYLRLVAFDDQRSKLAEALVSLQRAETRLQVAEFQPPMAQNPSLPEGVPLSLLTSIEVSDGLLTPSAQRVLRILALLPPKPNTFSHESAVAITAESPESVRELVNMGLLMGNGRYEMHHTISDYARMASVEVKDYRRLVAYFVDFAEEHGEAYEVLDGEIQNIVMALEYAFEYKFSALLVQGVVAAFDYWYTRGVYETAELHLVRAKKAAEALNDEARLAKVLLFLGKIHFRKANYEGAKQCYEQGLSLAQELGQALLIVDLLEELGRLMGRSDDYQGAITHLQEALRLADLNDLPERSGWLLLWLGHIENSRGNHDQAAVYFDEAFELVNVCQDDLLKSYLLLRYGRRLLGRNVYEEGRSYLQEALALARKIGDQGHISYILEGLGETAYWYECYDEAVAYLSESLVIARRIGEPFRISGNLFKWGELHLRQGQYDLAQEAFAESLTLAEEIGSKLWIGADYYGLAKVALGQGDLPLAYDYGRNSLAVFEEIKYSLADEVRAWLVNVPLEDDGVSGS